MYIYTCTYHVTEFNSLYLYMITAFVDMVPRHRIDKQLSTYSCEGFKRAFKIYSYNVTVLSIM